MVANDKFRRPVLSALLAGFVLQGCAYVDNTGPGAQGDAGVITLLLDRVDRQYLPVVLSDTGEDRVEITGGEFIINARGLNTYSLSYVVATTVGGSVTTETVTDSGSWRLDSRDCHPSLICITLNSVEGAGVIDAEMQTAYVGLPLQDLFFQFTDNPSPPT